MAFLLSDDSSGQINGCHYYRLLAPAKALNRLGWDVNTTYMGVAFNPTELMRIMTWADVIVTSRAAFATAAEAARFATELRRLGVAFVVDMDDLLNKKNCDPGVLATIRHATMVTTSTEPIASFYRPLTASVRVLPNAMDPEFWRLPEGFTRKVPGLTVGVQGSASHYEDWQILPRVFREVAAAHPDVTFIVAGVPPSYFKPGQGYKLVTFPWSPMHRVPLVLGEIDIHLAPLLDSPFNRAKTWIKWAEPALLGRPCVCSPVVYGDVVRDGETGLIARTVADWVNHIGALIKSEQVRRRIGEAARADVLARFSIETNADRRAKAYDRVIRRPVHA